MHLLNYLIRTNALGMVVWCFCRYVYIHTCTHTYARVFTNITRSVVEFIQFFHCGFCFCFDFGSVVCIFVYLFSCSLVSALVIIWTHDRSILSFNLHEIEFSNLVINLIKNYIGVVLYCVVLYCIALHCFVISSCSKRNIHE